MSPDNSSGAAIERHGPDKAIDVQLAVENGSWSAHQALFTTGKPRIVVLASLVVSQLFGCGEPFREEGAQYRAAVHEALEKARATSDAAKSVDGPYWNDCGREVTCLYLYNTTDERLIEAAVVNLLATQARIGKPGIRLTVYATSNRKDVFREITIK